MANISLKEFQEIDDGQSLFTTYFICEIVISMLAVVGNAAIIIAFLVHRRLRSVQNCYILSLAITDFSMGFFSIPFVLITLDGTRPQSEGLCFAMLTIVVLLDLCSIFSVMALTVDRFYAVCWPFKYHATMTYRRAVLHIFVAWAVPIGIASLMPLGWNNLDETGFHDCRFASIISMVYYSVLYFVCFVPLFVVMCVMYSRIFRVIKGQLKALAELQAIGERLNQVDQHTTTGSKSCLTRAVPVEILLNGQKECEEAEDVLRRNVEENRRSDGCEKEQERGNEVQEQPVQGVCIQHGHDPPADQSSNHPPIGRIDGGIAATPVEEDGESGYFHDILPSVSATLDTTDKVNMETSGNGLNDADFCQGTTARARGVQFMSPAADRPQKGSDTWVTMVTENDRPNQRFRRIQRERRTAILFVIIMVLLFVFWSPIYIMDMFLAFGVNVSQSLINFAVLLSHFNSAVNPFLYGYKSEFRGIFKQWAFCVHSCCCRMLYNNKVAPQRFEIVDSASHIF